MSKRPLLIATATLTLAAFSYVVAQEIQPKAGAPVGQPEPAVVESEETPEAAPAGVPADGETAPAAAIPGIRTEAIARRTVSGGEESAVAIPLGAVFVDEDRFFVLARGAESEFDFRQLEVELGQTDGQFAEVTNGLVEGDEVIVVAVDQLRFPAFPVLDCGTGECAVDGACEEGKCDLTGKCEEGACELTGANPKCGPAGCPTGFEGDRGFSIPAKEFFSDEPIAAGPGPVPFGGPVPFCPPF